MTSKLPFEIREAVVSVCGKVFWLKDPFKAFLLSCGVSQDLYECFSDESKYKITRHIIAELDSQGEEGFLIQRRIVTELCKLRNVPDETVPDRSAALDALRWLKQLALNQKIIVLKTKEKGDSRTQDVKQRQAAIAARAQKMEELRNTFASMASSKDDPHSRGYGLEDLLAELFAVHEITYRPPYRTENEQIDGHFSFKGFDYLVEARWRANPPSETDLGAFKTKVDKKITSTRGLFISIVGFRPEVVVEFTRGISSNILLMDGSDLMLILEGRISLIDALDMKTQKAAQEGIVFFPLSQRC